MPGESIQIGPFVGGLNTFSDATAIADNELSVCENFELDLDGSLVSRPPIAYKNINMPLNTASGNPTILGYYYGPGNVPYLIGSDGNSSTYYFNGNTWILITNTIAATAMAQFDNKAWLLAPYGSANPGGSWSPTLGFVAEAEMPKGDTIVAHKFRLWVAGGRDALSNATTLYFSNTLGSATFWPTFSSTTNFINVGAGDGQAIVRVSVYYNSLVIFRTNSIYAYQFTSDPGTGSISLLVPNIGLTDKKSLAARENYIYFMYDEKAYEFVNNRAQQINLKVPFESGSQTGIDESQARAVSIFGNRVIFSYFDSLYVYGLRTRTWTIWKSTVRGPIGEIFAAVTDDEYEVAITFSSAIVPAGAGRVARTLHITDSLTEDSEAFTCTIVTKNYNYQASAVYKRLFWWGVDAIFRGEVRATVTPITFSQEIYWSALLATTWSQVLNYDWNQPLIVDISIETVKPTTGGRAIRKFVKFLKSLRFRQINFRVEFDTTGSTTTAPVRVFSMTTYVRAHQRVSKDVT
jgi:hypothetical protein